MIDQLQKAARPFNLLGNNFSIDIDVSSLVDSSSCQIIDELIGPKSDYSEIARFFITPGEVCL